MKILSISTQKPHSTGSGVYLTELVNSFHKSGHIQAVVSGVYHDDCFEFPDDVGTYPVYYSHEKSIGDISFEVLGMSDVMPYPSTQYNSLTEEMADEVYNAFGRTIARAITDLDPDIIISHHLFLLTSMLPEMIKEFAPSKFHGRIYGLSHGSDLRQFQNCFFHHQEIVSGIRTLDGIFALHDEQCEQISSLFGIPKSIITVVGSGYNSEIFYSANISKVQKLELKKEPGLEEIESKYNEALPNDKNLCSKTEEPIKIIFAGKLSTAKGIFPLVEALSELCYDKEVPSFEMNFAGGCQEMDIMQLLSGENELKVGKLPGLLFEASYLGMLSQQELAAAFRNSDIFVLPSFYEGLPLVLIEAMASGLIPVCTELPGIKSWLKSKVINDNTIFVTPPVMECAGSPFNSEISGFKDRLKIAIIRAFEQVNRKRNDNNYLFPDTKAASWNGVTDTILQNI